MGKKTYKKRLRELRIAEREEAIRTSRWARWRKLVYAGVAVLTLLLSGSHLFPMQPDTAEQTPSARKVVSMSFPIPRGLVRRTMKDGKPGKGAVIEPTRIYVYPEGHGFLFFKNPVEGEEDVSVPFDGHHDAIVYLAGLLYEALKVAELPPDQL